MAGRPRRKRSSDTPTARLVAVLLGPTLPLVAFGCSSNRDEQQNVDGEDANGGGEAGKGGTSGHAGSSDALGGNAGTGDAGAADAGASGSVDAGAGGAAGVAASGGAGASSSPVWSASIGHVCGPGGDRRLWLVANPDFVACRAQAAVSSEESMRDGFSLSFSESDVAGEALELEGRTCRDGLCETSPITVRVDESLPGHSARGTFRVKSDSTELSGHFDAGWCNWDDYLPAEFHPIVPARGVTLREIAVFQGVKIPVMQGRAAVSERNAPIVAGRPALTPGLLCRGARP